MEGPGKGWAFTKRHLSAEALALDVQVHEPPPVQVSQGTEDLQGVTSYCCLRPLGLGALHGDVALLGKGLKTRLLGPSHG